MVTQGELSVSDGLWTRRTRRMAAYQSTHTDHLAEAAAGQETTGRQHPTGTLRAYTASEERGSAGDTRGGNNDRRHPGGN